MRVSRGVTETMCDKYLLYIDILGFADLVVKKGQVREVYNIIDSLNVHKHSAFKPIIFSDTILVYNIDKPDTPRHHSYLIMYLCEFAQDLFYRLVGRDIHFRAYLGKGEFEHILLRNVEAFYGEALVHAYQREHDIQCTGLFMEDQLLKNSEVFLASRYDSKCHFVHILQTLDRVSFKEAEYPIPEILVTAAGIEFLIAYDLVYLKNIHKHINDTSLSPQVRVKYLSTWQMIETRHKALLRVYERNGFDPRAICDFDWSDAMSRVGTDRGFHG
jgi:hypothetical protein